MIFSDIQGPEGSEEFCFEVTLSEDQELRQMDERNVGVFYPSGHEAFGITAVEAHDASGTTVPTTLLMTGADVVTLSVHHRAGNTAAGGAPFDYPISAGAGWEGGFQTFEVDGPPDESELKPTQGAAVEEEPVPSTVCHVPTLRGRSLEAARRALIATHCRLGPIRGDRRHGARVAKQYRPAGKTLPARTEVGIKLG